MNKYLFDIPVYRLSKEIYESNRLKYLKSNIEDYNPPSDSSILKSLKERKPIISSDVSFFSGLYGSWKYNEKTGTEFLFFDSSNGDDN